MVALLALPAPETEEDKASLICCGLSLLTRRLEPAGRSFHTVHEKPLLEGKRKGKDGGQSKPAKEPSDDEAEGPADASWRRKRKEGGGDKRSALKLSPLMQGEDLYALLELNETASQEQIKKQYRKMALQHHPDKQQGGDTPKTGDSPKGLSEKDKYFVKIQEAYEVLSDQSKRRQYDSSLDFDDETPEEVDPALGFYGTFAPVFRRNARWSTRYPVPELGEEKTDLAKVHKFYDFWFSFDSWRDFSMHDEYSLEEAEFREERRWMERQNQKIRKKYQEAERRRLFRLTETAERLDPRIRAEKEEKEAKKREEKEKRQRQKQEEEDAKRRVEEEKRRKEEQEQAAREEKERQEREARKQSKQVVKALRQRLRKVVQSRCKLSATEAEELQELCITVEAEPLEEACNRLEALATDADADRVLQETIEQWKRRKVEEQEEQQRAKEEARRKDEQKSSEAKDAVPASGSPWSTEELGILAKGLQRFPGGTGGRWALITQMIQAAGFYRSEKEVVGKTKELSDGQSLRSMGSRISAESTFQAPKAKAPTPATPKAEPAEAKAAAGTAAAPKAAAAAPSSPADWSPEQQQALEQALQRFPATLDKNERWKLIAEQVPGKTRAQCVDRFKFLREQLVKKG